MHEIIKSVAITIQPYNNSFEEFPDVFLTPKNLALCTLRPGMNCLIIFKNPTEVWKPRNIKPQGRFLADMFKKLKVEGKSGYIHRSEDIS